MVQLTGVCVRVCVRAAALLMNTCVLVSVSI